MKIPLLLILLSYTPKHKFVCTNFGTLGSTTLSLISVYFTITKQQNDLKQESSSNFCS